jgi:tetratricopeptide (TPR) repeat protein
VESGTDGRLLSKLAPAGIHEIDGGTSFADGLLRDDSDALDFEVHGEIEKRKEDVLSLLSEKLPNGEHANWKICEALDPHTRTVLGYHYTPQRCRLERAEILHNSAWYAWARGNYRIAGDRIQEAIDAREELLGRDDPNTLGSLGLLASVLNDQKWWKEGEELEVQVMETRKRVLGQEHPSTLTSMSNLASTYRNQGRWKEPEEPEVQAMETSSRVPGQEHPDTLTSTANAAHTWKPQGRDKEAIDLMKQAERLQRDILGSGHSLTMGSTQTLHEWQMPREAAESASSPRGSL